ncbi:hypothetical protein ACHAWO_008176 [Cyclotella atomus]|uniref:Chitin-binding type-1 domain-containing protein n=1 Tax=Cyclotella atomus TaxID=382360 RepID=A0ABD3N8N8_9STRA
MKLSWIRLLVASISVSSGLANLLPEALTPSPECGYQTWNETANDGISCPLGQCCGADGQCGTQDSYCQDGCQPDYGTCHLPECGFEVPSDINETVCAGGSDKCCSGEGFCGNSDDACGVGCQYGECDDPTSWADLPAAPPQYPDGACMRDVFNHFFDKPNQHPVCRAKEVNSFNATLINGPASCVRGTTITVNFTASFTVNSAVGRHDIALWTALDALCHNPPGTKDYNCARDGDNCSVTVFGDADIALDPTRIAYDDHKGGTDHCGDVNTSGTFSFAPRVLDIPCEGQYVQGTGWTDKVALQSCLSWRQPGGQCLLKNC